MAPTAHAQWGCYENPWECLPSQDAPADDGGDGASFWDIMGFWLSLVAILGSMTAGVVAYVSVRSKRQTVGAYLDRLERTYQSTRDEPETALAELSLLRQEVRSRYTKGRLEDAPFLELEGRILTYMGRLRLLEAEQVVTGMPARLQRELERLVGDGVVSRKDVQRVEDVAKSVRLAKAKRVPLVSLMERWAEQDFTGDP